MSTLAPVTSVTANADSIRERYAWRPLRLLALYRLVVALVLIIAFLGDRDTLLLGSDQPQLFLQAAIVYLTFALITFTIAIRLRRHLATQVTGQTLGDILLLGALLYAAGTEDPGLAVLMLVAVAAGGILVELRQAALFAAVAALTLMTLETVAQLEGAVRPPAYAEVGTFGMALFAVTIGGNLLARGAREGQALAEQRSLDLADQEALNHHIVQRLQDGVLVLDAEHRARLVNAAAWQQLGWPATSARPHVHALSPALHEALQTWQRDPYSDPSTIQAEPTAPVLQPRFRPLAAAPGGGVLVFLEDLSAIRAEVQKAKLASLGRLSASIAHEIRNPLSAMTHAAQLLDESDLPSGDRRLLEIIHKQGERLNGLVESVLHLSRRRQPDREPLALRELLEEIREDLHGQPELQPLHLQLDGVPESLVQPFDRGHLTQVVTNLVRNAADHARDDQRELVIRMGAGRDSHGHAYLDISDNGRGIAPDDAERLFEPFFTTAGHGTGLGLYLCRELCEANQARLSLAATSGNGSRFRITFPPDEQDAA